MKNTPFTQHDLIPLAKNLAHAHRSGDIASCDFIALVAIFIYLKQVNDLWIHFKEKGESSEFFIKNKIQIKMPESTIDGDEDPLDFYFFYKVNDRRGYLELLLDKYKTLSFENYKPKLLVNEWTPEHSVNVSTFDHILVNTIKRISSEDFYSDLEDDILTTIADANMDFRISSLSGKTPLRIIISELKRILNTSGYSAYENLMHLNDVCHSRLNPLDIREIFEV